MKQTYEKNRPLIILMLASILIFATYFPELLNDCLYNAFSPAFGELAYLAVFLIKCAVYIAAFFAVCFSTKKYANLSLFSKKQKRLHPKYALMIFVLTFAAIFFSCWAIGFDLPVIAEVGTSSTSEKVIATLSKEYLPFLFRSLCAVLTIALLQNFFETVIPAKYIQRIPLGGLLFFATCGVAELFIAADVILIYAYWIFYLFYGIVYVLSEKRLILTLITALLVIIL